MSEPLGISEPLVVGATYLMAANDVGYGVTRFAGWYSFLRFNGPCTFTCTSLAENISVEKKTE